MEVKFKNIWTSHNIWYKIDVQEILFYEGKTRLGIWDKYKELTEKQNK